MNTSRRLYEQSKKSPCDISEYGVWAFKEVSACRKAERICKQAYCRFISKDLLPDGYTETAPLSAIDEIIRVYEANGGVRLN